jgi:hypothetical protein
MKFLGLICKFASIYKQAVQDLEMAPAEQVAYNAAARHFFTFLNFIDTSVAPEKIQRMAAPEVYKETLSYYKAVLSALCARITVIAHCPHSRKLKRVTPEEIKDISNQSKMMMELAKSSNNAKELLYILEEAVELSKITDAFRLIKPSIVSAKAFPVIVKNTKDGLTELAKYEADPLSRDAMDRLNKSIVYTNQIDQASHSAGYKLRSGTPTIGSFADYLYRGVDPEKLIKMFDFKSQSTPAQVAKHMKKMLSTGPLGDVAYVPLSEYLRSHAREAAQPTQYPTYEKYLQELEVPPERGPRTKQIEALEQQGYIPKTIWHPHENQVEEEPEEQPEEQEPE